MPFWRLGETGRHCNEHHNRLNLTLTRTGPMLVFMLKHLQLAGCPFPSESIQCHPCDTTHAGGFAPDFGILICQDRFYSKKHLEDTLAHELLHAYDHCRFKVDWSNLRHHACSEVSIGRCVAAVVTVVWCRWVRRGLEVGVGRMTLKDEDASWRGSA